jgi:hypothetical protein
MHLPAQLRGLQTIRSINAAGPDSIVEIVCAITRAYFETIVGSC